MPAGFQPGAFQATGFQQFIGPTVTGSRTLDAILKRSGITATVTLDAVLVKTNQAFRFSYPGNLSRPRTGLLSTGKTLDDRTFGQNR